MRWIVVWKISGLSVWRLRSDKLISQDEPASLMQYCTITTTPATTTNNIKILDSNTSKSHNISGYKWSVPRNCLRSSLHWNVLRCSAWFSSEWQHRGLRMHRVQNAAKCRCIQDHPNSLNGSAAFLTNNYFFPNLSRRQYFEDLTDGGWASTMRQISYKSPNKSTLLLTRSHKYFSQPAMRNLCWSSSTEAWQAMYKIKHEKSFQITKGKCRVAKQMGGQTCKHLNQ